MGMDKQTAGTIQQGLDLFGDFADLVNDSDNSTPYAAEAEANARLTEQDALSTAWDQQQAAGKNASEYRATAEKDRSSQHANWGKSNLAMSGSKQLIDRSSRVRDRQAEDDILFQGDQDVRLTLNKGRRQGNMLRINNNASANGTTLSLGSKLYKYGG